MNHETKVRRVRVALGLDVQVGFDPDHTKREYGQVVADCAWALLTGRSTELCRSDALARLDATRTEATRRIKEYAIQPFAPANAGWVLLTNLDRLHRQAADDLGALF